MFVLNTISIVKGLHSPAPSSGQQSMALNHWHAAHVCCPREHKASDPQPCSPPRTAPFREAADSRTQRLTRLGLPRGPLTLQNESEGSLSLPALL